MSETGKFRSLASIGQQAANVQDQPAQTGEEGGTHPPHNPGVPANQEVGLGGLETEVSIPSAIALAYTETIPDFEASAADCINGALQIALSLSHTSLSSDHLMLALTMDQHARKLLERVGDIGELREAAMLKLGKMHWKFARRPDQMGRFPSPTSDLDEIRKTARRAAADRDQKVAISDLVNAYPREDGRLTYGVKETSESIPAVLARIESGLVPRVADFMSKFEAQVREGAQRQLAVALQEFGEKQLKEASERQMASLEEIGRQFKERHLAALDEISQAFQNREQSSLEAIGKQVRHDLETLAVVLQHFKTRLDRQEQQAPKPTAAIYAEPEAAATLPRDGEPPDAAAGLPPAKPRIF